jgi:leucyl aminopeptidase
MNELTFAPPDSAARPLTLLDRDALEAWKAGLASSAAAWVDAQGFSAAHGSVVVLPGQDGAPFSAAVGLGTARDRTRNRFALAKARAALPEGVWRLDHRLAPEDLSAECLGWLLEGYRFGRYRDASPPKAMLVAPEGLDAPRLEAIAAAEAMTRDLVNTPSNDMGPAELAAATRALAHAHGATFTEIVGEDLLLRNFPLIHTVGAASTRQPRLIELRWGDVGPSLTLVGKGVCFDTGGLNLKPGESMGLMKKDMGGAATVLGLAQMIMTLALPLRLRVLIPAVENSVSGNAFRPGDIYRSRKGLSVEINNTDAEGRLVLADALALADDESPDLVVSMATLTGAARVAVGPDIAPFFTDAEDVAAALASAAPLVRDPVWRLPFWDPYEAMIEPGIADLDNAPKGGFAGSITAALFLRRFVTAAPRYVHFDIYAWQPTAAPGRPKGGVGQGARALLEALPRILPL